MLSKKYLRVKRYQYLKKKLQESDNSIKEKCGEQGGAIEQTADSKSETNVNSPQASINTTNKTSFCSYYDFSLSSENITFNTSELSERNSVDQIVFNDNNDDESYSEIPHTPIAHEMEEKLRDWALRNLNTLRLNVITDLLLVSLTTWIAHQNFLGNLISLFHCRQKKKKIAE